MYGMDLSFTTEVKCPVCGRVWSESIAGDIIGLWCLKCKTYLEIKAKFTLELLAQKTLIDVTKIKKPSSKNAEQARRTLEKMGHIV